MTKKDYVLLIKVLNEAFDESFGPNVPDLAHYGVSMVFDKLCKVLKEDNPLFDETKFRDAWFA